MKKLFLLDAYALIYRAYYALIRSPRVTSDGRNTSAIFGFCNTLDDILKKENPPYIAVCFDPPGGHTFRHEIYDQYKAQRDKQPEDITMSVPIIKDIIRAMGIQVIEVEGYEADDVIGTLATRAAARDMVTYMMTPDKDYGQLVTDNIYMYRPALKGRDFEVRGPKEVCERYGISSPSQVIDLLALEGDVSDNIPGCPGVGEKTAVKLINEYGSVENLIANASAIKGALGRKIADNIEQIKFSKFLVTIKTDVPIEVTPESLIRGDVDNKRLLEIYNDLEFKSFAQRLKGDSTSTASTAPTTAIHDTNSMGSLFDIDNDITAGIQPTTSTPAINPEDVITTTDNSEITRWCETAANGPRLGLCVLADGEEAMNASINGIAMSDHNGSLIYIPVTDNRLSGEITDTLAAVLSRPSLTIISHALKRDMILLHRMGLLITAPIFDTAVAHYVLHPDKTHLLTDIAMAMLSVTTGDYALSALERRRYPLATGHDAAPAACERADVARRLMLPLSDALRDTGQLALATDLEFPLIGVLARMEWTGVRVDSQELANMSIAMTATLHDLEEQVYSLAGSRFNISSPSQVGEILFGKLMIDPKARRTKTGQFSTTEEILEKHRHQWPIVDLILKIRGLKKLLTTYIDALPRLVNPYTGKIHTTFNQTVTATGRISSTNPNLQNIPVRTDLGREIRRAFIADPGDMLLSADYSQIELRLMAHLSEDPTMIEAFNNGDDIHRATAAKIYHQPIDRVTDIQRRNAKTANFGIIYGISPFGLSERLGIPRAEAKQLIDGYKTTYPQVTEYIDRVTNQARKDGYVSTLFGRRRYLPEINSRNAVVRSYAERNAVNAPIQGSAADIIKLAMVKIDNEIERRGLKSRMILQVHDELIFNVSPDELPILQTLVTDAMEHAFLARVPLSVSSGVATNWLEAH
ncbi:MAG: DNA polymerase I [Muribaculaceae bacterium]|nr:DNA polymerase I [Muribaculaceae bacterium]